AADEPRGEPQRIDVHAIAECERDGAEDLEALPDVLRLAANDHLIGRCPHRTGDVLRLYPRKRHGDPAAHLDLVSADIEVERPWGIDLGLREIGDPEVGAFQVKPAVGQQLAPLEVTVRARFAPADACAALEVDGGVAELRLQRDLPQAEIDLEDV